jgi:hypothetical protein
MSHREQAAGNAEITYLPTSAHERIGWIHMTRRGCMRMRKGKPFFPAILRLAVFWADERLGRERLELV